LSGPIVLPANGQEADKLRHSILQASVRWRELNDGGGAHRALAICVGRPPEPYGDVEGYATFQTVGDRKEYLFVRDGKAKLQAQTGKFAVMGRIRYRLLASGYGCSLIDVVLTKFARHLPRLILTEIGCPVMGDPIYQRRVTRIGDEAVLIQPKDTKRQGGQNYVPMSFIRRLGITAGHYHSRLPMYMHVYQSLFPWYEKSINLETGGKERVDIMASSPIPEHFMAMLKALEFETSINKHLQALNEDLNMERALSSQETVF